MPIGRTGLHSVSANPQSRIGELEFELRSSTLRERSQLGVSFARAGALYKRGSLSL